jgi:excisionase family DNA binding protein
MRDFLTPEQVADLLQLNTVTVYRLIRDKKLAATKIGRAYRVSRDDLEAFLIGHSTTPSLREALFRRVMAIADRNPGVSSDDVLEELERLDQELRQPSARTG